MLFKIALSSLYNRFFVVLLTVFSIAVSVVIVFSVEHIRSEAKHSFTQTISGTDLIVGARSGRINLLLYSVFRIGSATNNIRWESYQTIAKKKEVHWAIPISLGDSHKGYRVLGTLDNYFEYYRYGEKQALTFKEGRVFNHVYDVVLGAEVAKRLGYTLGDEIVMSHGMADVSFTMHDDKPFAVVGILEPTGTPVDKTLHISLAGMEAIHIDWRNGVPVFGMKVTAEQALEHDLTPKVITAIYVGLNNKILTFRTQREINQYVGEPLMAILPGVTLSELWQAMSMVEKVLALISVLVVIAALLGMVTMVLSTLKQREQEIAVLRAIGASPWFIFVVIQLEVMMITLLGIVLGFVLLWFGLLVGRPFIVDNYGIFLQVNPVTLKAVLYSTFIILLSSMLACVPAGMAYKKSVGLTI